MQGIGEIPISTTNLNMNKKYELSNIWIHKVFNKQGLAKNMFKWYESGILGCGTESVPWIDLTEFITWPNNTEEIISEIKSQLLINNRNYGGGTCLLPKSLNGYHFLTHYQLFSNKYISKEILNTVKTNQELDNWVIENLSKQIWEKALMLKSQPIKTQYWSHKHLEGAVWNKSLNLPLTINWINSLTRLFKYTGRVVVYQNKQNHAVPIHRDFPINSLGHSCHFVNIQLTSDNRPAFVYDEITKEKIYTSSKAYMFNECDCHGVDSEADSNFTIRIDGTFQDDVCQKLNFINGKVFSLNYKNAFKFKQIKIFDPVDN